MTEITDGIFFDLPDAEYHAVERLSASGIQRLCVSPATFWASSHLNPDRPDEDEEQTKAQQLGKAYHCARLEPERFAVEYCREIDKGDYAAIEGVLWNGTEVGEALGERGETKKRAGESVEEQCERLEAIGYPHPLWPLEKARWQADLNGRIPIPAKYYDDIERDMERIQRSADIHALLSGGEPEVSIFWTDRYGIKMKARIDYLKPDSWSDFKTIDNTRGLVLAQALANAVRYNRLYVQAVVYREAVEAIRTGPLVMDHTGLTKERAAIIGAIRERAEELACYFIFQEKNGVPNLLAREFPFFAVPLNNETWSAGATAEQIATAEAAQRTRTGLFNRGLQDIDHAKREFMTYSQIYRPGQPWAPPDPIGEFSDADFNRFWLEGTYE